MVLLTFVQLLSSFCHHDNDKFQIELKTRFDRFSIENPYYMEISRNTGLAPKSRLLRAT